MPDSTGKTTRRFWPFLIAGALLAGATGVVMYPRIASLTGRLGVQQHPEPPPPSDTLPGAPGPDNTIQSLPSQPDVPAQPPSPIDSETNPSRKPTEH